MLKKYSLFFVLIFIGIIIFLPIFKSGQIPFSSNLLASFFNPWAQEKFPGWIQGIPNKPLGIDDLRIFYPQRSYTINMLKSFQIPYWNPYNFSGNYHAGLSETAVFYPLFLLFLLIPQLLAWIFLQVIEPFIAAFGMYLFLRILVKSNIAATFGAIVFGFSGVVIVRMVEGLSVGHTLIWLPLAFFGLLAFSQTKKIRFIFISTVALCFSLLAGWFQYTFYIVLLSFIFAIFIFIFNRRKSSFLLFLPFVLLPLLTLIHIIPSYEMLQVSTRSATTTQELLNLHLMPWYHLLTFLSPDFWGNPGTYNFFGKSEYKESILYIGVIPFILSFFSLAYLKKKEVWFFVGISILGMVLGIDTFITRNFLSLPLPIISSFLPNRIFIISVFGLSVLSSYGFLYLYSIKKISRKILVLTISAIGIIYIIVNGYVLARINTPSFIAKSAILTTIYSQIISFFKFFGPLDFTSNAYQLSIFTKNLILPDIMLVLFIILLFLRKIYKKRIFVVGVFALTIFCQIYFAQKYIPWSYPQFVFPSNPVFSYLRQHQDINRFISLGQGYIPSDIPLFFGLYSPDGVGSMYIDRYGELVTYAENQGKITKIPRIEIRINPSTESLFSGNNFYLSRFLQIDGIKYLVKLRNETNDPEGLKTSGTVKFPLVWQNNTWQIFENKNVLPRFFWTNKYVVKTSRTAILKTIFNPEIDPRQVVLEKFPSLNIVSKSEGSVTLVLYSPQKIILKTFSTGNGLIFISDEYSPNFVVTIDGRLSELLRADYVFRAIPVMKGNHTIVISYQDNKEMLAFIISGISCFGVIVGIWYAKKKKIW